MEWVRCNKCLKNIIIFDFPYNKDKRSWGDTCKSCLGLNPPEPTPEQHQADVDKAQDNLVKIRNLRDEANVARAAGTYDRDAFKARMEAVWGVNVTDVTAGMTTLVASSSSVDDFYDAAVPIVPINKHKPTLRVVDRVEPIKPETYGFDHPEDGSAERFSERRHRYGVPWADHTAFWLIHNCIAHPLIGLFPFRIFFRFHDFTSRRLHGLK